MLTHEELMEKCQELRQAMDTFGNDILTNGFVYDPNLDAHKKHIGNMTDIEESLLSTYFENRASISDADAKEIITLITEAYFDMGFAGGCIVTEENTPDSLMLMTNSHQNKHE